MVLLLRNNIIDLPTSFSLSYLWCGGFMISFFLVVQLISGIILSFLYVADANSSFSCVLEFTSESVFMWFVRYLHIWGVSFIFILFLMHMGRALYYASYVKVGVWNVGFILYLLMMVEAFMGYILPWHQMSYWAATVLTSIVTSIPIVGSSMYSFIVGGFGVTDVTLVRVFSVHVCLAFVIVAFSLIHLFYLHMSGSNNPLSISKGYGDVVTFHMFYTYKDGLFLSFLLVALCFMLVSCPDCVLDTESYIEADPLVTPVSIKPEWYFLAFYAMLRSIESKIGGLVLVVVFLIVLWLPMPSDGGCYAVFRQGIFWSFVFLFISLSYLGACHPEFPFVFVSKVFSLLLVLLMWSYKWFWVSPYFLGFVRMLPIPFEIRYYYGELKSSLLWV